MKVSDEETVLLTGEADYTKAAEVLVKNGAEIAVVTLGKDGAYVCTKSGGVKADGRSVTAVDCTGAGDSFWGAFLIKVAQSGKKPSEITLDEAAGFAGFANAAASICVENYGAIPSLPTIEDVEKRL